MAEALRKRFGVFLNSVLLLWYYKVIVSPQSHAVISTDSISAKDDIGRM